MAESKQTYTTLRAFPHHGRVIPTGGTVQLHPRQAKYLLGTHLTAGDPPKTAKSSKTKGDQ